MHILNKVASCLRAGWKASEWFRAILCCLGPACCSVRSMLSIASEFPQAALEPRKNKLLQQTQNNCRFKLQAFQKKPLIVPVFKNHTWKKLQATSTTSTKSNVSSWLVARVAIVAIFPNYSETHVLFGGFAFVAKQNWESPFFWKKTVIAERHFFPQKRCSSVKFLLISLSEPVNASLPE